MASLDSQFYYVKNIYLLKVYFWSIEFNFKLFTKNKVNTGFPLLTVLKQI